MQHVPRFFVNEFLSADMTLTILDDNHHHIRNVLRMKVGEKALIFNGKDGEFEALLESCERHESKLILKSQTRLQKPECDIWLFVGILKSDMMGLLVEKATELQVAKIIPFASSGSSESCKADKLRLRAVKAAQQCERLSVPEILDPVPLQEIESHLNDRQLFAAIERGEHPHLATALKTKDAKQALLIGPAGGFSDSEIATITNLPNCQPVSLGESLLRAETAAIMSLSLLYALQE